VRAPWWIVVVAACGSSTSRPDDVWQLDVDLPDGWSRKNIRIDELQSIELRAPSGDIVHIYPSRKGQVFASGTEYITWKNQRYWEDEVEIYVREDAKLPDGWAARFDLQTKVRPTQDALVYSTRKIGGRYVDCVCDQPKNEAAAAQALAICKSTRFTPGAASDLAHTGPPPPIPLDQLRAEAPADWPRDPDRDFFAIHSPDYHINVTASRVLGDFPATVEDYKHEHPTEVDSIEVSSAVPGGFAIIRRGTISPTETYLAVYAFIMIHDQPVECSATVSDRAEADVVVRLCASLHF
jgi:hypothetical protein